MGSQAGGLRHGPATYHLLPHYFLGTSLLEGAEGAGVEHEVGGGGGAHGAEALEQTDDEEDQGLVLLADAEGALVFEGSVIEGAAEVERVIERGEGSAEVGAEGLRGPDRAGGEQAGENRLGANGGALGSSGDDRHGGAVEVADGAGFVGGVLNPLAREGWLDLENRVNAFRGDVKAGGVRKQERRVEIVEDGDIDLAGAAAERIDDEGGGGPGTLGGGGS